MELEILGFRMKRGIRHTLNCQSLFVFLCGLVDSGDLEKKVAHGNIGYDSLAVRSTQKLHSLNPKPQSPCFAWSSRLRFAGLSRLGLWSAIRKSGMGTSLYFVVCYCR